MLNRSFFAACLIAALAACERPQHSPVHEKLTREAVGPTEEKHALSAAPEHFDRVRAEQFEKEEDRLRKRSRN